MFFLAEIITLYVFSGFITKILITRLASASNNFHVALYTLGFQRPLAIKTLKVLLI